MNIKFLVLVLLGPCLQNVNGSKSYEKRNKGGRLMSIGKFGLGLLSLNCAALTGKSTIDCPGQSMEVIKASDLKCGDEYGWIRNDIDIETSFCDCLTKCENENHCVAISFGGIGAPFPCYLHSSIGKTNANHPTAEYPNINRRNEQHFGCFHVLRHCPQSFPPNALFMMDYIRCSDAEDKSDFHAKYLAPGKNSQQCSKMQILYENAQKLGECIYKGSSKIIEGAKARILGQNNSHKTQAQMFEDYLGNFDLKIDEALELVELFEKNEKFDFFRVKAAVEVFSKTINLENTAKHIKSTVENYETYKEYNFDHVEHVANLLKPLIQFTDENLLLTLPNQVYAPMRVENEIYVYQQALEPWIQQVPLEKIEKIIQSAKNVRNAKLAWEMKVKKFKKKYKKKYDL